MPDTLQNIPYHIEQYEATVSVEDYVRDCVDVAYFQGLCKSCPRFQNTWSCPTFDFDALEYWNRYSVLRIIGRKVVLPPEITQKSWSVREIEAMRDQTLWREKRRLTEDLFELEREVPGSVHVSAGYCLLCGDGCCERSKGLPCRNPDRLRYSIESLGGNVTKTAAYIGQELDWTAPDKMPHHFLLVCGLLYN